MTPVRFVLAAVVALVAACALAPGLPTALAAASQTGRTFVGTVTDDMCHAADHSRMRMGATDAECATACADAHAAAFVLFDGKAAYRLSDQKGAAAFAARRVRVTGTLDAKTGTIAVDSIRAEP